MGEVGRKGKMCPEVDERCHYLECLQREGCIRSEHRQGPLCFRPLRVNDHEPAQVKEHTNG